VLAKRIIPCLDVTDGRVVKGTNFVNLRDARDPVECAIAYNEQEADELVFLDITASSDERNTMVDVVRRTAQKCFIPLTVGGGIRSVEDMREMLLAGADKVGINTAAVNRPDLINEGATAFGNQCIVVAIDAKREGPGKWGVYTHGGRTPVGLDAIEWAKEVDQRGAGEILLTSMDSDGTKAGYDIELTRAVSEAVAREMAEGARAKHGADFALATTGIAGPNGGTEDKPVGTVFIALAGPNGTEVINPCNPCDRETFKYVSTQQALDLLRRNLWAQKKSAHADSESSD